MPLGEQVPDDALLLRWVPAVRLPIFGTGRHTPASDTWAPSSDDAGSSVVIVEGEVTPAGYLAHCGHPALVSATAAQVRAVTATHVVEQLDVVRDPLEDDDSIFGAAHALVVGWPTTPAHKKKMMKAVLQVSVWVGEPQYRDP